MRKVRVAAWIDKVAACVIFASSTWVLLCFSIVQVGIADTLFRPNPGYNFSAWGPCDGDLHPAYDVPVQCRIAEVDYVLVRYIVVQTRQVVDPDFTDYRGTVVDTDIVLSRIAILVLLLVASRIGSGLLARRSQPDTTN